MAAAKMRKEQGERRVDRSAAADRVARQGARRGRATGAQQRAGVLEQYADRFASSESGRAKRVRTMRAMDGAQQLNAAMSSRFAAAAVSR